VPAPKSADILRVSQRPKKVEGAGRALPKLYPVHSEKKERDSSDCRQDRLKRKKTQTTTKPERQKINKNKKNTPKKKTKKKKGSNVTGQELLFKKLKGRENQNDPRKQPCLNFTKTDCSKKKKSKKGAGGPTREKGRRGGRISPGGRGGE